MDLINNKDGVTEMLGTLLLLIIAVVVVSSVFITVLSNLNSNPEPQLRMVGRVENCSIVLEHQGGDYLNENTTIIFKIAGVPYIFNLFDQDLDLIGNDDSEEISRLRWNAGEKLYYYNESYMLCDNEPPNVEAQVIFGDYDVVFKGTLIEGYIGKGGIWHFDEDEWKGIPEEVKDDSGHDNHGVSIDGANTRDDGVSNRCGFFDTFGYVKVDHSFSLDIRDEITVETWIKSIFPPFYLENRSLGEKFSYDPMLIRLDGDYFAVVGEGYNQLNGFLKTYQIFDNGTIEEVIGSNETNFGDKSGNGFLEAKIIKISDDIYGLTYITDGSSQRCAFSTINILSSNGQIVGFLDEYISTDTNCYESYPLKINDDMICLIYCYNNYLKIATIDISNPSEIKLNDSFTYYESEGFESMPDPEIIKTSDNFYAICYETKSGNIKLNTIKIFDNNATLVKDFINQKDLVPDSVDPDIINTSASNEVFAILYSTDNTKDGMISIFNIYDAGVIGDNFIQSKEFTGLGDNDCKSPKIINLNEIEYVITYQTGKKICVVKCNITSTDISINETSRKYFEKTSKNNLLGYEPYIVKVNERVCALAFRSEPTAHEGQISTVLVGYDKSPKSSKGIVKGGSASIYADTKYVYAYINGESNSLRINIEPYKWYHVVLTYDQSYMKLYCTEETEIFDPMGFEQLTYTQPIQHNYNDLNFGRLFSGYLDEIAIFDRALTTEEIQTHFENPGIFE